MMSVLKVVTIGQNKLWIYYLPQASKCPHLYHCQETLSMTKVKNCPFHVYSLENRSKCYCVFACSSYKLFNSIICSLMC